jgi:hypothetical protein
LHLPAVTQAVIIAMIWHAIRGGPKHLWNIIYD